MPSSHWGSREKMRGERQEVPRGGGRYNADCGNGDKHRTTGQFLGT